MSTAVETDGNGGITAFEVEARPSKSFQGAGTRIRWEFGRPVSESDMMQPHARMAQLAAEQAWTQVDQLVEQTEAATRGEVERQQGQQAPASAEPARPQPQPAPSGGGGEVVWRQGSKPNGRGSIRYRPTDDLSTDAFKQMIAEALKQQGADPGLHKIFDERVGKYGLEQGNERYSPATVKPSEDSPHFAALQGVSNQGKQFTRASFHVDFNDDGTVRAKMSDDYAQAVASAQTQQIPVPAPPEDTDDEPTPF